MITWGRKSRDQDAADTIYGSIVAQARQPEFYVEAGVPDTLDGRFELLVMHAFLYFHRMKPEGEGVRRLTQLVFDTMFQDLDHNLREMGVGDMSIGKKVRKMGGAFYGRTEAYDQALSVYEDRPVELVSAIERNVFAEQGNPDGAQMLARYMSDSTQRLSDQNTDDLLAGIIEFPELKRAITGENSLSDA